jgi:hypothetical protein
LELGRLVKTLGYEVAGTVSQRRDAVSSGSVLGEGKLRELAEYTGGTGVVPGYVKESQSKARARFEAAAIGEADDNDEIDDFDDLEFGDESEAKQEPPATPTGNTFELKGEPSCALGSPTTANCSQRSLASPSTRSWGSTGAACATSMELSVRAVL